MSEMLSYEAMKIFWERRSFKVIESDVIYVRHEKTNIFTYTKRQLLVSYEHLNYTFVDETKGAIEKPFIKDWIRDCSMRIYKTMRMYPPPLICPPDHYNTWQDFDIESTSKSYAAELLDSDLESTASFLEHIRLLFSPSTSKTLAFDYVINMFAQMFQHPSQKIGVALIINGVEGVGKNRLLDLIKLMMGTSKYLETPKTRDVYDSSATVLRDKILVIINSGVSYDNQTLKELITSAWGTMSGNNNELGMMNYSRVVFTMNNPEIHASNR
jgi:hypothetical protein